MNACQTKSCKQCGNKISGKKIFCNKSCAASFNNSGRIRSEESKKRLSILMKDKIAAGEFTPTFPNQKGKTWAKLPNNSWLAYKSACVFYTPFDIHHMLKGYSLLQKYGWWHPIKNPSGVSRDHMYSVKNGWLNNIPIDIIRHPANCNLILNSENNKKGTNNSIELEELLLRIENWRA